MCDFGSTYGRTSKKSATCIYFRPVVIEQDCPAGHSTISPELSASQADPPRSLTHS